MTDARPLILDSHLDLSFSALQINRDLTQKATTVRVHDSVQTMEGFGSCTVTFPELRRGKVGLFCGTVMSRLDLGDRWTRTGMYCQAQCHGVGRGHLAYYQALERTGLLRFVKSIEDLDETIAAWQNPDPATPFRPDPRHGKRRSHFRPGPSARMARTWLAPSVDLALRH